MKDPHVYLVHLRDCVDIALADSSGRDWSENPMDFDANCRHLEIIGEPNNNLAETYRAAHPSAKRLSICWTNFPLPRLPSSTSR